MILGEYVEKHSPEKRAGKRAKKQENRRLERAKKIAKRTDVKPISSLSVRTRHIPQRIQDLVWIRDGHRCSFPPSRTRIKVPFILVCYGGISQAHLESLCDKTFAPAIHRG